MGYARLAVLGLVLVLSTCGSHQSGMFESCDGSTKIIKRIDDGRLMWHATVPHAAECMGG
jgi:hypothetical protein